MNAYELADWLNDPLGYKMGEIANMLRQQADRIAELEKICADLIMANEMFASEYTTPQTKPLSDEEIIELFVESCADDGAFKFIEFARAIEAKVRGKK